MTLFKVINCHKNLIIFYMRYFFPFSLFSHSDHAHFGLRNGIKNSNSSLTAVDVPYAKENASNDSLERSRRKIRSKSIKFSVLPCIISHWIKLIIKETWRKYAIKHIENEKLNIIIYAHDLFKFRHFFSETLPDLYFINYFLLCKLKDV